MDPGTEGVGGVGRRARLKGLDDQKQYIPLNYFVMLLRILQNSI